MNKMTQKVGKQKWKYVVPYIGCYKNLEEFDQFLITINIPTKII